MRTSKLNIRSNIENLIKVRVNIKLKDLLKSHFQFKLDNNFKRKFLKGVYLRKGSKTWIEFSKELDISERHLRRFLLNGGYNSGKLMLFTTGLLYKLLKVSNYKLSDIEKYVTSIRTGEGGRTENIKLPLIVSIFDTKPTNVKRDLAEYVLFNKIETFIEKDGTKTKLPNLFIKIGKYVSFDVLKFLKYNYIKRLHVRQAKIKEVNSKKIKISYINSNDGEIKKITLPRKLILDEIFFREFGKWIGDRSGHSGLSGKDVFILSEFCEFLKNRLFQTTNNITGRVLYRGILDEDFHTNNLLNIIKVGKIRFDKNKVIKNFVYEIYGSKLIRKLIFDPIEFHLNQLLGQSKQSCRYAFYSGLFEAEGCFNPYRNTIEFGFGASPNNLNRIINTWIQALQLFYWLKKDKFIPEFGKHTSNESIIYRIRLCAKFNSKVRDYTLFNRYISPYLTKSTEKFSILNNFNKEVIKYQKMTQ